eukprot:8444335-Karenia_brevis.AAC.1
MSPRMSQHESKRVQNASKMGSRGSKIRPKGSNIRPKLVLDGILEGSDSGGHVGPKSQQDPPKLVRPPPRPPLLGSHDGGQNPPKSGQKSPKKSMIFGVAFWMASGSILGPILEGFGPQ